MMQEIKDRWKADMPDFFKKVRALSITLGSSATAVWGINTAMNLQLPELIMTACKYIIAASVAMGATAQLTKQDPPPTKP